MASDVLRTVALTDEELLDDPFDRPRIAVEFAEHSRRHDPLVTPVLRYIRQQVAAGVDDEQWYEEQLYFLLHRLFALHRRDARAMRSIPATRASTRRELFRRVGLGLDFINPHFAERIGLEAMASAAMLSPYHFLRVFKAANGVTPSAYLRQKRELRSK